MSLRFAETALCAWQLLWLARSRNWGPDQIELYQRRALERMLRHAVQTVPYYRGLGFRSADLTAASLAQFPLLTKAKVQRHESALLSEAFATRRPYVSHSSGSMGRPTSTWYDRDAWILTKRALKLRRVLTDLGRPPYRVLVIGEEAADGGGRFDSALAGAQCVSIHDGIEAHLDVIARFRPTGIYGSPSWLVELVQAAQREKLHLPHARVVWTSSELLTEQARHEIEAGFGCPVRDVYGSTEFKEVAVECVYGRRHVNFESSFVEILPAGSTDVGSIVITGLVNRAMPLIRYQLGDIGRVATGACPCGRAAPWLTHLGGREVDLIALPDGQKISPYLLSTIVETHTAIARYQLLERAPGDIEVRYQLRPGGGALETEALAQTLNRAVAGGLRFSFVRTEDIERTPAGKYRPLIRAAGPQ